MEIDARISNYCRYCKYRLITPDSRIFDCSLTNKAPDFDNECKSYWEDPVQIKEQKLQLKREIDAKKGRKKFIYFASIMIGISVLNIIVGTFTFYNYQNFAHLKALIRLLVELGMLYAIYNGNLVVKHIFTILCILAIIVLVIAIPLILQFSMWGLVYLPLAFIYFYGIVFLNFDKHFLSFFNLGNNE